MTHWYKFDTQTGQYIGRVTTNGANPCFSDKSIGVTTIQPKDGNHVWDGSGWTNPEEEPVDSKDDQFPDLENFD